MIDPDDSVPTRPKPGRDETVIKALVRTHRWRRRIENGQAKRITDLAAQDRVAAYYDKVGALASFVTAECSQGSKFNSDPPIFGDQWAWHPQGSAISVSGAEQRHPQAGTKSPR